MGQPNYSGVTVTEMAALGISAFYRASTLIAGSLGGLPWRTVRDVEGVRTRVTSFLDDPGAVVGMTPYSWKETSVLHQLIGGDSFQRHVFNGAGAIAGLVPVHPGCVRVEWDPDRPGGKKFTVTLEDGTPEEFDASTMTQIPGPSLDGLRGLSIVSVARNSLGAAIAADRSSAKMFSSGALISGLVSAEEDIDEAEARTIKESLDRKVSGWENAGEVAVVNRKLKFQPWTQSGRDAQFLETRQFMIQEIARWTGVPASLLMDPGSVSTWGTGVEIQQRGLGRFTLTSFAHRFEQALSRLLPAPRFVEVDFAGLERGTPQEEIDLLIRQVEAGLMTPNEARRIRNMEPIEGGDVLRGGTVAPAGETATVPDAEAVPV